MPRLSVTDQGAQNRQMALDERRGGRCTHGRVTASGCSSAVEQQVGDAGQGRDHHDERAVVGVDEVGHAADRGSVRDRCAAELPDLHALVQSPKTLGTDGGSARRGSGIAPTIGSTNSR